MSERGRTHVALFAAMLGVLAPSLAAAQAVDLTWDAPATCPGQDAVITRLRASPHATRPLRASARVTQGAPDGRWRVHLETDDGLLHGERELDADTCAELVDAITLILTLTLDAQPDAPPPPPPLLPPPPPPPPRAPSATLRLSVRVQAGVDVGRLPSPAPLVSLAVSLGRGRWRVEALAAWVTPQQVALASGAGAELDALYGGARGCVVPHAREVEVRACGGLDVGVMRGEGFGLTHPAAGSSTWIGAALGGAVTWRARPWLALTAALDATVMLDRPSFVIRDLGEVHAPSRVGLVALGGAELAW